MMGFPCIAYDKKLKVLLANNYVVIRMDEKTDTKNQYARYDRYVADIVSPSMTFDKLSTTQCHAYIVTIYIEYLKSKNLNYYDGYAVVSGIAVLDLVTGDTKVTEFYSKDNNEYHCLQEVYRYLTSLRPKEVIIHIDDMPKELSEDASLNPFSKHLEKVLECKRYDRYNVLINKVNAEYKKINYQTDFFNKLYNTTDVKNKKVIDELDLARAEYGRLAFLLLIQYCYEQNGPVAQLNPPVVHYMDEEQVLILTHNAALCLEVIPTSNYV